ncbi:putative beta-lactamase HcpC precursor [Pseudovibrio sp. Ad13]|uniref:tetratricopeptide repeat protein n=1 Tax=Pseudovibrio sp. Ad13 TaxID=989396 RepID=UPI0007AEB6D7|nr:tetratricopeptide repeat protein [Pseudovibrio sp. Ad13]KZK83431.1 putative beta-lactamase HcpC precursor [Pseudovibrio sp. Ad13]
MPTGRILITILFLLVSFWQTQAAAQTLEECKSDLIGDEPSYFQACKDIAWQTGDKYLLGYIGRVYFDDERIEQNYQEAAKWFLLAAERGNSGAQQAMGTFFEFGMGVPRDYREALKWYLRAAEDKDASAFTFKALGRFYENGRGTPPNYKIAMKWYHLAAKHGDEFDVFRLGDIYARGQIVPQDLDEAEKWYSLAAEQGNASAQASLAEMYLQNRSKFYNPVQGYKWLLLAELLDNEKAKRVRRKVEGVLEYQQIVEGQRLAREWWDAREN